MSLLRVLELWRRFFIILGAAAMLLAPLIPALLGLGIALGLIGVAFSLFGVGAYLVAKAFQAMAKAGISWYCCSY